MRTTSAIAIILLLAAFGCGEAEPAVDDTAPAVEAAPEVLEGEVDTIDFVEAEELEAAEDDNVVETTETVSPAADPTRREQTAPIDAPATEPAPDRTRTETPSPPPARSEAAPVEPESTPVAQKEESAEKETASSGSSMKRPKTHTVDNDGVMHASGLETPQKKCAVCHGKDLQGGKVRVGCFDCHEKNWE